MNAARLIRRASAAQAVPALVEAARRHPDEYVRNRAFILLTGFNDRGTADLAKGLIRRSKRSTARERVQVVRAAPGPAARAQLARRITVRNRGVRASGSDRRADGVDQDPQVQRALVTRSGRGLDFSAARHRRSGRRHAAYAVDAIAPMTRDEGPLQQDAVLAIGRIGGPKADGILTAVTGATPRCR
jgi:hypothetical protein